MAGAVAPALGDRELRQFRALVHELTGIDLHENKRALLAARLNKRLRHLGLTSFAAYHDLLTTGDPSGSERVELINAITTNKTDFFREPHHFDFLRQRVIPELRTRAAQGAPRRLRVWSAGCSTGEEPYSIAMTLRDGLLSLDRDWDIRIVASDIDTAVLEQAARGIYAEERLATIPEAIRRRHFQRGMGKSAGTWRVRPELRELIDFQHLNLTAPRWPLSGTFDAIFCRNVVIYFDQPTQQRIAAGFADMMSPTSYLFVGHSESMIGVSNAFSLVGPTTHRLEAAPVARSHKRLQLGELFASRAPAQVSTVLGSCVSACLFDPVARVGGMNHFLLPGSDSGDPRSARYGVQAMELLVARILELGGEHRRLQAKVIGANNVMQALDGSVAKENVRFVRAFLDNAGIPLVGERLGRLFPTEARFMTDTGQLRCRDVVNDPGARP